MNIMLTKPQRGKRLKLKAAVTQVRLQCRPRNNKNEGWSTLRTLSWASDAEREAAHTEIIVQRDRWVVCGYLVDHEYEINFI